MSRSLKDNERKNIYPQYDAENRLISITFATDEYKYFYAGDGFLAKKEKWVNSVYGSERRFVRSDRLTIQERDETNAIITWGLNKGGGIGGLLSLNDGTDDYRYLYDGKGNVVAVINSSQTIVASYRYDEFGNQIKITGTLDQPYQFSTKRFDGATGLSYYGYRFYNAEIGKWMTRDPLGEAGGINLYGFVGNNGVNGFDAWGLAPPKNVPPGVSIDANVKKAKSMSHYDFYNAVKTGGKWDYKKLDKKYQDFGNYNYGLTGRAAGYSEELLRRVAGGYQIISGTSKSKWGWPWGLPPYGDDPTDQYWINEGIKDFSILKEVPCP